MDDLLRLWWVALPPSAPEPAASKLGDELLARWSEPHRRYHTTEHLVAVLRVISAHETWAADPPAVRLAAFFHDAVYDPRRVDNEEASAQLAEAMLPELGVPSERVIEVARLVRLTATHDPDPGDENGALLSDADLSILTAPAETYRAYTAAVRQEYSHLSEEAFSRGREGVLFTLLTLPRLYHNPALHDRWEDLARQNLTRELASLRGEPLPFPTL
jgi:predicted metal-dependent HD superfamily phosphohydrolase